MHWKGFGKMLLWPDQGIVQALVEGLKKTMKNLSLDNWYFGGALSQASSKCKSRALPLHKPVL
jgi:hypothetical protein